MTDASPNSDAPTPGPRRRLPTLVLVAVVAVGAGLTGAFAATVTRHTDVSTAPTSGTAPSDYVPDVARAASGPGGGAGAAGVAAPQALAAPGAPTVAQSSGGSGAATYPYPGGVCTGGAAAQPAAQTVTATGTSTIGGAAPGVVYVLNGAVTDQTSGDVSAAVAIVQQRIGAVVDALVRAGVPRSSIHTSAISVYAGGKPGAPVPATTRPSPATNLSASASLSAQLPDAGAATAALRSAADAGADGVSVSTQYPAVAAPSPDALSAALARAGDQAHQLAAAAARATGVNLGAVRSVSTQQPTVCGYGVDGPQLVVGVTLSYAIP